MPLWGLVDGRCRRRGLSSTNEAQARQHTWSCTYGCVVERQPPWARAASGASYVCLVGYIYTCEGPPLSASYLQLVFLSDLKCLALPKLQCRTLSPAKHATSSSVLHVPTRTTCAATSTERMSACHPAVFLAQAARNCTAVRARSSDIWITTSVLVRGLSLVPTRALQ